MKKIIFLIMLFKLGIAFGQVQKWETSKIDTLENTADTFVGRDTFGAFYFIKNNILIKKTKEKTWQYKNVSFGKIAKVDFENPLNILLFYDTFNTVILLDNQLTENKKINFSEINTAVIATAVGIAFGNKLWVYNSLSQQIGLFDYLKSEYKPITTSFKGNLKLYNSNYNSFQWIDEDQNWYTCNIYGNILPLGKTPDFDTLKIISNSELLYKIKEELFYFNRKENKTFLIDVDKKTFSDFYYKDQFLTIFTNLEITNYKITTP